MSKIFLLFLVVFCSSCSPFKGRDVGKANMLSLNGLNQMPDPGRKFPASLIISYPTASPELDTYRISVERADKRKDYFAGSRWNEFLPSIVQQALKETLSNSLLFNSVETNDGNNSKAYRLITSINAFEAVYSSAGEAPSILISIKFSLKNLNNSLFMKEFTLAARAQAKLNTITEIAYAFKTAFEDIEKQLTRKISTRK